MTTQTEALKLALALVMKSKRYADECSHMATQADIDEFDTVATAIKEALAQPEQEPVAWWDGKESVVFSHEEIQTHNWTDYWTHPLYTTPPQRKPLTDEQIMEILGSPWFTRRTLVDFAREIEAAHGIKE